MYKEELLTVESYRSKEDHVAFVMKIIAIAAYIWNVSFIFRVDVFHIFY